MSATEPEVMRSYTKGLKVPTKIGAFVDGTRIPGGPYSAVQGVCGAGTLVLGYLFHGVWGGWLQSAWTHLSFLDWPLLIIASAVVLKVTGYIPETTRNPVVIAADGRRASFAPRYGTRQGHPIKAGPGPVRVTGRVIISHHPAAHPPPSRVPTPPRASTAAAPPPHPAPVSLPTDPFPSVGAAPVSHVAQLLAKELK